MFGETGALDNGDVRSRELTFMECFPFCRVWRAITTAVTLRLSSFQVDTVSVWVQSIPRDSPTCGGRRQPQTAQDRLSTLKCIQPRGCADWPSELCHLARHHPKFTYPKLSPADTARVALFLEWLIHVAKDRSWQDRRPDAEIRWEKALKHSHCWGLGLSVAFSLLGLATPNDEGSMKAVMKQWMKTLH